MQIKIKSTSLVQQTLPLLDPDTYYGEGAMERLPSILKNHKDIVLFYDKGAYQPSGAANTIEKIKNDMNLHTFSYSGMALPVADIQNIYVKVKSIDKIGLIVALGGGTILDLAKTIALAYANGCATIDDLITCNKQAKHIPLFMIPTTCGTGSEATSFAAIFKDKTKISLSHPTLEPRYKILDPTLLHSLPPSILGPVVLDGLAQAIESVWAVAATSESQIYAKQAIRLILAGLNHLDSPEKFGLFLLASHLSGKAINISKTTMCHSISYPLTAHFNISHGVAVYLSLPYITRLNFQAGAEDLQERMTLARLQNSFKILFDSFELENIDQLTTKLKEIAATLKVKLKLRDHGIKREDIPFIVSKSYTPERAGNNPRKIEQNSIQHLLGEIF